MSIRGLITSFGLLDSTSEILTLGLDSAAETAPDGFGNVVFARTAKARTIADLSKSRQTANITAARTIAEMEQ